MGIISLKNVVKDYYVYKRNSQRIKALLFNTKSHIITRALDDINIEIEKGETVAVIGRRGSRRTTLLRTIIGTCFPDSGKVKVKGKVNPMITMSIGMDYGLNAHDNIILLGSMLGLSKKTIKENEQAVIDFADANDYIDLAVNDYPPGMAARLGLGIHLIEKPDILVLDEPFSVGTMVYRDRCLKRLKQVVDDPDVTFVFVCKNQQIAKLLCQRGIVLEKGKVLFDGEISEAFVEYKKFCATLPKTDGGVVAEDTTDDVDESEEEAMF